MGAVASSGVGPFATGGNVEEAQGDRPVEAGRYVLGHTARELERLQTQARVIDPHTHQFFVDAGIEPGMRVLDVGTGAGDVAFLLASLVGQSGEVVGVDRSATAIAVADERARASSTANVNFRVVDPFASAFDEPFDAVAGRYVLQFQPDPVAALRALAAHARPGGLVVLHEIDWGGVDSFPSMAAYNRTCGWIREAVAASRTETRMGIKLYSTFVEAGFAAPCLARRSVVGAGDAATDIAKLILDLAGTLRSEIIGGAIASVDDFETTLLALPTEVRDRRTVLVAHGQFCVWGRVG
jgi:ubiquinone/menaquinone biosynthesis C-methylase UbiE